MNSKKFIKQYKILCFWWDGFYKAVWVNLNKEENDKVLRQEIEVHLMECEAKIKQSFRKKIGDSIMSEVRK